MLQSLNALRTDTGKRCMFLERVTRLQAMLEAMLREDAAVSLQQPAKGWLRQLNRFAGQPVRCAIWTSTASRRKMTANENSRSKSRRRCSMPGSGRALWPR